MGVEAINRPAITFVPGESMLDSKLTVEVQSPLDPNKPANQWNSTNSVKKRSPILGENGTSEDYCKTVEKINQVISAQGNEGSQVHFKQMLLLM